MNRTKQFGNNAARPFSLVAIVIACFVLLGCANDRRQIISNALPNPNPEERALAFLSREVPLWSKENKCYSCHNNGDAARALYTASRHSYPVPLHALADTSAWLSKPSAWDHNKGEPGFSDKRLARIQFAAALVTAIEAGHLRDRRALVEAADLVAECQEANGAWRIATGETLGSPATYGTYLVTGMALRTLRAANSDQFRERIQMAERWLRQAPIRNVLEAAAVLLTLPKRSDAKTVAQRERCLDLIRRGQSTDGGWGPYLTSPPEPFDTAVVLLALASFVSETQTAERIRLGRSYLIATQRADGSWPETTRPPGAESYAQHLSTTGWATLALLATTPGKSGR